MALDLFDVQSIHLIKTDGDAFYYPSAISQENAMSYFNTLLIHPNWSHDKFIMFGKPIITKRKVMWVGDKPFSYRYAGMTKYADPWPDVVSQIKNKIERITQTTFNSCLLNLYDNGDQSMGWHSDNEPELKKHGVIASVSLGAERTFKFKHKKSKTIQSVLLANGSLLLMQGELQTHWQHQLPPTKKINEPRINLTFRTIDQP